jgi:hypothetical protein
VGDHFDISQDPVKVAQLPVGALLFLRGDVAAARETVLRSYSREQVDQSMRLAEAERPYYTPGFPLVEPLVHGTRIGCLDCEPQAARPEPAMQPIRSDTGELSWQVDSKSGHGLVSVDTARSTALVGWVRESGVETGHLAADVANQFCALTVSSLDGKPLSTSSLLLLTATGRVENTGMEWNQRRAMVDKWGTAPTRIETIRGWVTLKELEGAVGVVVTPLDGNGRPLKETQGRRLEGGWEVQLGSETATSYLLRVVR